MRRFTLLPIAVAAALALVDCSSSDEPSPSTDGGESDTSTGSDAAADTGAAASVNGCGATELAANDHTAPGDARAITFPGEGEAARQFAPPCMRIKAGQAVTWTGGFTTHPLEPSGGDSPSPITVSTTAATTRSFTFPTAGTYGFDCLNHPGIMRGAIEVLP